MDRFLELSLDKGELTFLRGDFTEMVLSLGNETYFFLEGISIICLPYLLIL